MIGASSVDEFLSCIAFILFCWLYLVFEVLVFFVFCFFNLSAFLNILITVVIML